MEPIFNKCGRVLAWRDREEIYNLRGNRVASLSGQCVYLEDSTYIGVFKDGYYFDLEGNAVAFEAGAKEGPELPELEDIPLPPELIKTAPKVGFSVGIVPALITGKWSNSEDFF